MRWLSTGLRLTGHQKGIKGQVNSRISYWNELDQEGDDGAPDELIVPRNLWIHLKRTIWLRRFMSCSDGAVRSFPKIQDRLTLLKSLKSRI